MGVFKKVSAPSILKSCAVQDFRIGGTLLFLCDADCHDNQNILLLKERGRCKRRYLRWEFIKENKKVRKQEKNKKNKENKNSTKKVIKKVFHFFFLGRVLVYFLFFLFS